ncbi:MAG TPA: carbon starvation CstA family protein [Candidatus Limnocylindria bacterium]|jgi:carbon starvation protein|nr:carbon starvation CstA family protein [Candidatus Limnocylindria bacterium]
MKPLLRVLVWLVVAGLGAFAYFVLATRRGEPISSAYLVVAAVCTYAIGYRFYSAWLAARVLTLDDRRATPCEVHEDGHDFVKTNKWIVFGHHFAAISGPGPLVGPVLAAQFGYLPSALWLLVGVVLGGAVQDFVILVASMRRNGKSLGQMVREELNSFAGTLALVAILAIMIILLAVLAVIVVNALAESPWGIFTVGATIPIAMLMGGYLRWFRAGKTLEASILGVLLLLGAVWGGQYVHSHDAAAKLFTISAEPLAWGIIAYGLAASVLPVWLLLAPRDYLSTFMKLGTIVALALGVLLVLPVLHMPAITKFADGSGPVVPGKLFPFCFITIACGAISGFHALIGSGITPKIITRESYARPIGYGAMCLESLVAIMALVAACTLDPGVYLAMNIKGQGPDAAAIAADTVTKVNATGFIVDPATMTALANDVGEKSLYGRTGGAATLAVGMASIFSKLTQGRWLDLWYHFAIMFEALFILTTLDAGTRVGRYLLQDFLGHLWKPLGNTRSLASGVVASVLIVAGWGFVLISAVRNPDGGTKALWPIFGIANQLLAAIALCLATTILLKAGLGRTGKSPKLALVTLIPLLWLLTVTFTAGWQKMFHESPRIGFRAGLKAAEDKRPAVEAAFAAAQSQGDPLVLKKAQTALKANELARFNTSFDFAITGLFLAFAAAMVAVSVWEWLRLLLGSKLSELCESEPVWLPDHALKEGRAGAALGVTAIAFALLKEWSGESAVDRAQAAAAACACVAPATPRMLIDVPEVRTAVEHTERQQAYVAAAEQRFEGINRCC